MTMQNEILEESVENIPVPLSEDEKTKVELYYSEKSSRYTFTQLQNTYLNNSLRFADTKAGALVAVNGLIIKFVADYLPNWQGVEYWLGMTSIVLFVVSICISLIVVYPRNINKKGKGFIYWGYIAKDTLENYQNQIQNGPVSELLEESIRNNYQQAIVLDKKFQKLNLAFKVSYLSYFLLAVMGVLFIIL